MRKYYLPGDSGHAHHEHWDTVWNDTALDEALRVVRCNFLMGSSRSTSPRRGRFLRRAAALASTWPGTGSSAQPLVRVSLRMAAACVAHMLLLVCRKTDA